MTAPSTKGDIESAITGACPRYVLAADREWIVDLVWGWRSEWLRDAEPRRRPVSEKTQIGDVIAIRTRAGTWRTTTQSGRGGFLSYEVGWVLLERAKPKTLAEEARELANDADSAFAPNSWNGKAAALLRRIAEQEKSDE